MDAWLAGEYREIRRFDGTLASLIEIYATHPESPYRDLKYSTQLAYDDDLKILKTTVGARRIDKLTGDDFRRWYRRLKEPKTPGGAERVRRAHGVLTMMRILLGYGRVLGIANCGRLKDILSEMRFKTTSARDVFITVEQVTAFIAKAHEKSEPEMALAQALQFEGMLRQIDVIGEWVPDPADRRAGKHWTGGLLWQHISKDYVLQKTTTKTGAAAAVDFREYPLALAELQRVLLEKRIGPVIIDSRTGQPFRSNTAYSRRWRVLASAVGIPDDVWNRDSRAGGVTEGSDAGADLEQLRHHASHSSTATTARYSRQTLTKTRTVARLRMAHRQAKTGADA